MQCFLSLEGESGTVWHGRDKAYLSQHLQDKASRNVRGPVRETDNGQLAHAVKVRGPSHWEDQRHLHGGISGESRRIRVSIGKAIWEGNDRQREMSERKREERDTFWS